MQKLNNMKESKSVIAYVDDVAVEIGSNSRNDIESKLNKTLGEIKMVWHKYLSNLHKKQSTWISTPN